MRRLAWPRRAAPRARRGASARRARGARRGPGGSHRAGGGADRGELHPADAPRLDRAARDRAAAAVAGRRDRLVPRQCDQLQSRAVAAHRQFGALSHLRAGGPFAGRGGEGRRDRHARLLARHRRDRRGRVADPTGTAAPRALDAGDRCGTCLRPRAAGDRGGAGDPARRGHPSDRRRRLRLAFARCAASVRAGRGVGGRPADRLLGAVRAGAGTGGGRLSRFLRRLCAGDRRRDIRARPRRAGGVRGGGARCAPGGQTRGVRRAAALPAGLLSAAAVRRGERAGAARSERVTPPDRRGALADR